MPGFAVHFWLASQILDRVGDHAAFSATDPAARNAFLNGSIGPDMGYFPGGYSLPTDLAHYVFSAELVRNLIREAASPLEKAYAWGWFTHVLADIHIHPMVNRAAGDLVLGTGSRPLTFGENPGAHARVEIGLDSLWFVTRPDVGRLKIAPLFDRGSAGYLERAFARTYDVNFERERLLASHLAAARYSSILARVYRIEGARHCGGFPAPRDLPFFVLAYLPVRYLSRLSRGSMVHSFANTVAPSRGLLDGVTGSLNSICDLFHFHFQTGLPVMADHNLDTGETGAVAENYPLARKARAALADLRAGSRPDSNADAGALPGDRNGIR